MRKNTRLALALVLACSAPGIAQGQLAPPILLGPDGEQLPFADDQEIIEFLRDAEIVAKEDVPVGVTMPYRLLLRRNGVEAHAIFRYVDERATQAGYASERGELFFRDSAGFECAAYELSRILGLTHVPPVVERSFERQRGTLQIWVEGAMTEAERLEAGREDPVPGRWSRQLNVMNVFDALIGNIDRNRGNMLADGYWRLWFIDHTRAFRGSGRLDTSTLTMIEEGMWEALQALDRDQVERRLGPYLTSREMTGLLERADAMVAHYRARIRRLGPDRVIFTF